MDNLTHSLVGLAAAKAGLEKLSPGATTLCVLAANAPDSDTVTLVFGRWVFLQQHRGVSHSIAGALVLALLLPVIFYLGDLLLARRQQRRRTVRLPGLLLASVITTATHPLLDWTNNYGVRPLLPWSPRWFYGDFVFIIDPFIWIVLGGAAFLLTAKTTKRLIGWGVIALISSYVVLVASAGAGPAPSKVVVRLLWVVAVIVLVTLYRRNIGRRAGAKLAVAALVMVAIYISGLAGTHVLALRRANLQASAIANRNGESLIRVAAMPTAANPTEWLCVMETDRATYRFMLSLWRSPPDIPSTIRYEKPEGLTAQAVAQATRDRRAQVFLGFARFPVVRDVGEDCLTQILVEFADLRYTEPGNGRGTFSLDVPVDCPVPGKQ